MTPILTILDAVRFAGFGPAGEMQIDSTTFSPADPPQGPEWMINAYAKGNREGGLFVDIAEGLGEVPTTYRLAVGTKDGVAFAQPGDWIGFDGNNLNVITAAEFEAGFQFTGDRRGTIAAVIRRELIRQSKLSHTYVSYIAPVDALNIDGDINLLELADAILAIPPQ